MTIRDTYASVGVAVSFFTEELQGMYIQINNHLRLLLKAQNM
jgi:hypothetical protein